VTDHAPEKRVTPHELTATDASRLIREGRLSCEDLVRSCLDRIDARDASVRAWSHVDPAAAIRAARERDKLLVRGPLHGLPLGVKDIIETSDMPTTYNSPLYINHRTRKDAACVAIARHRGAIILGKTDTVEFASGGRKALTRNPHNLAHTPGGSSSGSAAAVADRMVPIAFGTQTVGSLIRPAAFTGIYAFKPTYGVVNRDGVRNYSPSLDTVGWYGRSVPDLRLVAEAFRLVEIGATELPRVQDLRIGICRTPMWERAEYAGRAALTAAAERLVAAGAIVEDFVLPSGFERLPDAQHTIVHGEGRAAFLVEYLQHPSELHVDFRNEVDNALGITPRMLIDAYNLAARCREQFDNLFGSSLDALLTLAAPGEAPKGLHSTGDWIFNGLWTLLHVPCVAIPAGTGPTDLPVGVQLIGPRLGDELVLSAAAVLAPLIDVACRLAEAGTVSADRPLGPAV
jgi:Asp-tRNA(Asn)/Glu-tRNA(Gln) amidotransferase A subunit family amidase